MVDATTVADSSCWWYQKESGESERKCENGDGIENDEQNQLPHGAPTEGISPEA